MKHIDGSKIWEVHHSYYGTDNSTYLPSDYQLTGLPEKNIGNYFYYGNIVVVEAKEGIVLSYKKEFLILLNTLNITEISLGAKFQIE